MVTRFLGMTKIDLTIILDYHSQQNDKATCIENLNITTGNTHLYDASMMQAYNLDNLIKEPTCFQSDNPSQIDLILTNQKHMSTLSNTFENGFSDHHKLISTTLFL